MNKPSRAIKQLEQKSFKGELMPSLQLYENYQTGRYVIADPLKATEYINKCEKIIKNTKLSLSKLKLRNFRRFKEFEILFEPNVTVIIGENGTGKSSIIDSIAKSLSWLAAFLEKENNNGKKITPSDINNDNAVLSSQIETFYQLDPLNKFELSLSKAKQEEQQRSDSQLESIRVLAKAYRTVSSQTNDIDYPFLAYYGVERSNITVNNKQSNTIDRNRIVAYRGAFDDKSKLIDISNWFIQIDNLSKSEHARILQEKLTNIQQLLDSTNDKNIRKSLKILKKSKEEEYQNAILDNSLNEYTHTREQLNTIIAKLIPNVSELRVDRSSGQDELVLSSFNQTVSINQLSHGQKSILSMIVDIVYRLTTLNPHKRDPLSAQGIVLIDEIELHLHPQWQQTIIDNLCDIFPNIQFIITTHSPYVLSTVDVKSIRILKEGCNNVVETDYPSFQTKGVSIADIVFNIMNTTTTPNINITNQIIDYKDYISKNEFNSSNAKQLYERLTDHFGKAHPVMLEINELVKIQIFKNKVKNRFGIKNEETYSN